MLNPARANSWIVASCSEPFGIPSLSLATSGPRLCRVARQLSVEAGPLAGVAHVPVTQPLHLQQHGIVVAIDQRRGDLETVAGGLALGPQLAARAAEKRREPGLERERQGILVHEPDHQHLVRR